MLNPTAIDLRPDIASMWVGIARLTEFTNQIQCADWASASVSLEHQLGARCKQDWWKKYDVIARFMAYTWRLKCGDIVVKHEEIKRLFLLLFCYLNEHQTVKPGVSVEFLHFSEVNPSRAVIRILIFILLFINVNTPYKMMLHISLYRCSCTLYLSDSEVYPPLRLQWSVITPLFQCATVFTLK